MHQYNNHFFANRVVQKHIQSGIETHTYFSLTYINKMRIRRKSSGIDQMKNKEMMIMTTMTMMMMIVILIMTMLMIMIINAMIMNMIVMIKVIVIMLIDDDDYNDHGDCNDGGDYNDANIDIDGYDIGDGNIAVELVKIYIYHIQMLIVLNFYSSSLSKQS